MTETEVREILELFTQASPQLQGAELTDTMREIADALKVASPEVVALFTQSMRIAAERYGLSDDELEFAQRFNMPAADYAASKQKREQELEAQRAQVARLRARMYAEYPHKMPPVEGQEE